AGLPFLPAVLIAGLIGAVIMTVVAAPSWRLSGHYPAIATLATGAAITAVAANWNSVTGGGAGIALIPQAEVFGIVLSSNSARYGRVFVVLLILCGLVFLWSKSHVGMYWRAIRDDEVAARAAGIATPQYKSLAFGVSGF